MEGMGLKKQQKGPDLTKAKRIIVCK